MGGGERQEHSENTERAKSEKKEEMTWGYWDLAGRRSWRT